jgi:hypothetical protein
MISNALGLHWTNLTILKRNGKEWYQENYTKNLLFQWCVVAVIFDGHLLGPTSRAGTLQPDAGLNPHPAAWPENLNETKHNPFTLRGI